MKERKFRGRAIARAKPGDVLPREDISDVRVGAEPVQVWCLSPSLCTVVTHWDGSRTGPCFRVDAKAHCQGCNNRAKRVVQSWIQTIVIGDVWRVRMCHLTPHAVTSEPLLIELDGALWGRKLDLWRKPAVPRGRLFCDMSRAAQPLAGLPEAPDAYETLCLMWGAPLRRINFVPQSIVDAVDYDPDESSGIIDWRG